MIVRRLHVHRAHDHILQRVNFERIIIIGREKHRVVTLKGLFSTSVQCDNDDRVMRAAPRYCCQCVWQTYAGEKYYR